MRQLNRVPNVTCVTVWSAEILNTRIRNYPGHPWMGGLLVKPIRKSLGTAEDADLVRRDIDSCGVELFQRIRMGAGRVHPEAEGRSCSDGAGDAGGICGS